MLPESLLSDLRRIVGRENVLTEPGQLLSFESDALTAHRATPASVVFVHDLKQLIEVVRALNRAAMPFVPRGAGTGLSGGALADGSVVIELSRMNRILWVDAESRRARVQPGVINLELNDAIAPHGLMYAPDPSSQRACTLGGNIAENSGGPHCLKYGVTTNHVLGLTVVMPDAEVIELTGSDGPGYDLVGLFVGSEGTLGICSEIELQLVPLPETVETLLAHFDEIDDASRAVSAIIASGIVPAALEMIDRETLKAVEASVFAAGFPTDLAASLIVELDGPQAGIAEEAREVEQMLTQHGARRVARAENDADRVRFWAARKSAFGAFGRLGCDLLVQDATVPRSRLPKVLAQVLEVGRKYDLEIANVFHAGDGNLHPNIPFDRRDREMTERVHAASREIMEICIAEGGTITGEHGVGIDKRAYMSFIYSADDRATMRWVKEAFDPAAQCNPGKILPEEPDQDGRGSPSTTEGGAVLAGKRRAGASEIAQAIETGFGRHTLVDDAEAFALGGVGPEPVVVAPGSVDELRELMRLATRERWAVVPAGLGSWLSPGHPLRRADLVVSTRQLDAVVEHHPDDLFATAQAGTTLQRLAETVGRANQWWALDPLGSGSVGANIATASAGPLAATYGTPRDLVLGLTVVLADGSLVKAGGRVVKNVAGYDMVKLFTGSWGTLGVIVEAHLRLHAKPQADRTRLFFANDVGPLISFAGRLGERGTVMPAAAEILSPLASGALGFGDDSWLLAARWLGGRTTVDAAVSSAIDASTSYPVHPEPAHGFWSRLNSIEDRLDPALAVRVKVPIAATERAITLAAPFAGGQTPALVASLLSGRVWAFVPQSAYGEASDDRTWLLRLKDLREVALRRGGTLRVERAPEGLRELIDPWGDPGRALRLQLALKAKFDPGAVLKPGFFVGRT